MNDYGFNQLLDDMKKAQNAQPNLHVISVDRDTSKTIKQLKRIWLCLILLAITVLVEAVVIYCIA